MTLLEEIQTEVIQPANLLRADQDGTNVLILARTRSICRFDGKKACYRLEHRWLSDPADPHAVRGQDFTFWQKRELDELGVFNASSLFDCFNLF
jgi:hypothetical protein